MRNIFGAILLIVFFIPIFISNEAKITIEKKDTQGVIMTLLTMIYILGFIVIFIH